MKVRDIFGLDGLADLGPHNGVDMRPTLLRVLTDLYVHRFSHTASEERHYTELALRLLEAVDVPTRVAVARRFARYLSPPLRVLQWLTRDLPEVAAELRAHPLLQPPAHADAAMPNAAMPLINERAAAEQKSQTFESSPAIDAATAWELNEQFFAANTQERQLILLNINIVAPIAADRIRISRDTSVSQRLEAAALTGKREESAQQLARALQIPREQARRIVHDDLGEPVVVAAKALSMPRNVFYRMLMFINPAVGHSVERVHGLAALYDELTAAAAAGMVAIWQALPQNEQTLKPRPLAWHEKPSRRAQPAASIQHPTAPRTSERRSAR